MGLTKTIVLLPCHSLEDFPLHLTGSDADGLLAAWTALWHPVLLAATESIPAWYRADFPPENAAGTLYALPAVSEPLVNAGWVARATGEGGLVVRKFADRTALLRDVAAALAAAGHVSNAAAFAAEPLDPELALDFMALGYAYLQVELLTRQMRYMSNLDELQVQREAVAGAKAALIGDIEAARKRLQQCFDVLLDARERFYPADNYLLDLTLVADSTLGPPLARALTQSLPVNVLLSGSTARRLAETQPEAAQTLRQRLDDRTAGLVGGEENELESPLCGPEETLQQFLIGRQSYHQALGRWPRVYGRRRFGLSPSLPQVLQRLQFDAAVHFTLDDGVFPQDRQSKTRWEGLDNTAIDALTRLPVDASDVATFLRLPQILGETMDLDHVAVTTLAHWPGGASPWYDDLRRATRYAQVFGKFVTIDEFFSHTDSTGRLAQFPPDDYRSPYLRQAVQAHCVDPISSHVRQWQAAADRAALDCLRTWASVLGNDTPAAETAGAMTDTSLADAVLTNAAQVVAKQLTSSTGDRRGTLLVNPSPVSQRWPNETPSGRAPGAVDVPAWGFAWVAAEVVAAPIGSKNSPQASDELNLRNEFLDVLVDPTTGGIHAVHAPRVRGNVLSQQLAYRLPSPPPQPGQAWNDPQLAARYTRMQADKVVRSDAASIVSQGQLLDETGRTWARYQQRLTLLPGDPLLRVQVSLEDVATLGPDPWTSYVASRLAWNSQDADLFRGVHLTAQLSEARTFEAPDFIELRTERWRLALLTAGLPYHRRSGDRMLDTLLTVKGDTRATFRFALGVNLARLAAAATACGIRPLVAVENVAAPPTDHGWLFHLDQPHALITHWAPLHDEGRAVGLRLRVMETSGIPGPVRLHAFRPLAGGVQTDFTGEALAQLRAEEGALRIPLGAFEWAQVEARFAE